MKAAKMLSPANLAELTAALPRMTEKSRVVAGGTDLVVAIKEGRARPDLLLNVLDVKEMRAVLKKADALEIGAAVPFGEIASAEAVRRYFPALADAAVHVGSKQIRNRGTIGGNIGSASPAGDMLPVLLLYGASLRVAHASGEITERPFASMIEKGRLLPPAGSASAFVKLGSRTEVTIARLSIAMSANFDTDGRIASPAVTLGALAKAPIFAREAMTAIAGNYPDEASSARLAAALAREVDEAIPGRSSQPYKRHAVRGAAADVFEKIISRRAGAPGTAS